MPANDVTITATFFPSAYRQSVDQAIALIEKAVFSYPQEYYGYRDDLIKQLVIDINKLIASTGLQITESDIILNSFRQAIAGEQGSPQGKNGGFDFTVTLTKGAFKKKSSNISGTIRAMIFNPPNFRINISPSSNGTVKADRTFAPASTTINLTISQNSAYEVDSIWVIRAAALSSSTPLTLSGTDDLKTFVMPPYDVTVYATFRLKREVDNENILKGSALKAWVEGESLHVTGLTAGQIWRVCSLSGMTVYQNTAGENGEAVIQLSTKGIYIVQSGNKAIKVIKY